MSTSDDDTVFEKEQQQKSVKVLKKDDVENIFPKHYIIIHSMLLVMSSLATILIQTLMINYKVKLYKIGYGIWAGCYNIVGACLALTISTYITIIQYVGVSILLYFFSNFKFILDT